MFIAFKAWVLVFLICSLFWVPAPALAGTWKQIVVSYTVDGDTIRGYDPATGSSSLQYFRFSCVDALEKKQVGGKQATATLAQLAQPGDVLNVEIVDVDKYLRPVAIAHSPRLQSITLNEFQVGAGNAVVTPQYLRNCPQIASNLQQLEAVAQQAHLNIWANDPLCLPEDYRKKRCAQ